MTPHTANQSSPLYDVAVIGAGLAGALCSHLLTQAGKSVCVIDKSRGTGGRSSSQRLDDNTPVDMGAPYLQASKPEIIKLIEQWQSAGLATRWPQQDKNGAQAYTGTPSISTICRHLIQDSEFINNTRAHHLERDHQQQIWRIRDYQFQLIAQAKTVIICVPAQQAATLLAATQDIEALWLRANRASRNSRSQWALWLETPASDLATVIRPQSLMIDRLIKDNQKAGRHDKQFDRWIIHSRSDWAADHLEKDKEQITQLLSEDFCRLTELSVLRHGTPHRWLFSRYQACQQNTPYHWHETLQIALAGDWLSTGNTEGALFSAQQLIKHMHCVS